MSKNIRGTIIAAALLIVVATVFKSTFVVVGSGLVLSVGLIYASTVSLRNFRA